MAEEFKNIDLGSSFFISDEWIKFCNDAWHLKPSRLIFQDEGKPYPKLECVIYRDKKNRIITPPVQIYLGLSYSSTTTDDYIKLSRQWQQIVEQFAIFFSKERSIWFNLPPDVIDVRGLRWHDFVVLVGYTYKLHLPMDFSSCDHAVRKNIAKAQRSGYFCTRLGKEHINDIYRILSNTEKRQNFSTKLTANSLAMGLSIIGEDSFRCYGTWSPEKILISVRIVLFKKGSIALDWVAGTDKEHLNSGGTQLLISYVLSDLHAAGCSSFDFCGATLKHLSRYKENWGGVLTPYYTFRKKDFSYVIDVIRFVIPRNAVSRYIENKLKGFKIIVIIYSFLKRRFDLKNKKKR